MNRVGDHLQFAVWFVGLGYLALWPVTAHDNGIAAPGAALFCGGHSSDAAHAMCEFPHALRLSPGLHLIGTAAAAYVLVRLLLRQWRHWRRQKSAPADAAPNERNSTIRISPERWPAKLRRALAPPPSPRPVRPRRHFGLRGAPH